MSEPVPCIPALVKLTRNRSTRVVRPRNPDSIGMMPMTSSRSSTREGPADVCTINWPDAGDEVDPVNSSRETVSTSSVLPLVRETCAESKVGSSTRTTVTIARAAPDRIANRSVLPAACHWFCSDIINSPCRAHCFALSDHGMSWESVARFDAGRRGIRNAS